MRTEDLFNGERRPARSNPFLRPSRPVPTMASSARPYGDDDDELLEGLIDQAPAARSAVRSSQPARRPPRFLWPSLRGLDLSDAMGRLGVWMVLAGFALVWWGLNGGYSVVGLGLGAQVIGGYAVVFHALLTAWTFPMPVEASVMALAGLPISQPVLPWMGVVGATILQIVIVYRKLRHLPIRRGILIAGAAMSLYDVATTFVGVGTISWVPGLTVVGQGLIAVVLTFGLEGIIALLLERWQR